MDADLWSEIFDHGTDQTGALDPIGLDAQTAQTWDLDQIEAILEADQITFDRNASIS